MKKSLLALAVLGAFTGVASAQSSVSLYGTIDLNGRYIKNDGSSRRFSLSQDGINSSQLGFRGTEDLGGGLKAGFLLLSGVNADTGTFGTQNSSTSKFFNRRSTVSLMGGFGEVRLGRDYTPSFWNNTIFDAFGTNGVGDSSGTKQLQAADFVRADNSIGYFLPSNLGGVYGQFMAAAGESAAAGRYLGGRVGFATGPLDIAVSYSRERMNAGGYGVNIVNPALTIANGAGETYRSLNVGGAYDFGVVKLLGYFNQERAYSFRDNIGSLSAVVPIGQGEVHVGGEYGKLTGPVDNKVKKFALGYVYNLSKRTALYGTAAYLDNDSRSSLTLGSAGTSATAVPTPGGKSKGAEVGIRHFF